MTQQYIQLITGAKEIKKLNPGGPDNRHNSRPKPFQLLISLKPSFLKKQQTTKLR